MHIGMILSVQISHQGFQSWVASKTIFPLHQEWTATCCWTDGISILMSRILLPMLNQPFRYERIWLIKTCLDTSYRTTLNTVIMLCKQLYLHDFVRSYGQSQDFWTQSYVFLWIMVSKAAPSTAWTELKGSCRCDNGYHKNVAFQLSNFQEISCTFFCPSFCRQLIFWP